MTSQYERNVSAWASPMCDVLAVAARMRSQTLLASGVSVVGFAGGACDWGARSIRAL